MYTYTHTYIHTYIYIYIYINHISDKSNKTVTIKAVTIDSNLKYVIRVMVMIVIIMAPEVVDGLS